MQKDQVDSVVNPEGVNVSLNKPSLNHMRSAHDNNSIDKTEIRSAKEFMNKVQYRVPLKKLYKVVASC